MLQRLIAFAVCVSAAVAQTVTGTLEGRVTDPAGASVPAAQVRVKETSTGIARSSETNPEGSFQIPYLPLGTYDVSVEASGFQALMVRATIELNRATVLNLNLAVAGTQQAITVTDVAPIVDPTSGQIRRSVSEELIETIPIAGRDFRQLFRIIPGFQSNPTSGQDNFTLSSGSSASFNGTGTRAATFQTDGIANDDNSENQNRQGVNISTIREFQVLTNSFSAEFGRGAGAVVLVQTKSGTNDYHGEAYWMTTNSALNARSYFANAAGSRTDASGNRVPVVATTSAKTHRPGGVFGGPIVENKLFAFGSYERFWAPGSVTSTVSLIPQEFRTPRVDPTLPDAAARRTWVQSVIDRYPNVAPNNTVTNPYGYTASVKRTNETQDMTTRVDYNVSDSDIVYGRYQYGDALIENEEIVRGTNAKQDHTFQNAGLTWTHVFSPRWSGEGRVGFGRRNMLVGLVDGPDTPLVLFSGANTPSNIGNAGQYPLSRVQNDFQYVYNVATQLGSRHNIRFGTDTRRYQLNENIEQTHRGQWTFSAAAPYSTVENFARGVMQSYQQGFGPKYNGYRTTEVNLYIQDQFKVTNTLTLELGARFEYTSKPTEVNNLVDLGYGSDAYIEPRFGFAYSPGAREGWISKLTGGPGSMVIRGGYGMYHGRIFQSIFAQGGVTVRFNPPQGATVTFTNPDMSVANPLGGYVFTPGAPTSQVTLVAPDPNLRNPYTQQWNFTLERALPWQSGLSLSYIGNRGIGFIQYDARNRAQFPITSTVPANYAGTANFTGSTFDKVDPNLFNTNPAPGFISLGQLRTNPRRPDGRYGTIFGITNSIWTYYNALQAVWNKRLTSGLSAQIGYTWSKNIDTGSEATFVGTGDTNFLLSDRLGPAGNRGLSRLDQPQRFVASYTYQFPWRRNQQGALGRMIGGWEMNGIVTLAAGNPVTVVLGYDLNADGIGGDRPFLVDPAVLGRSMDNARVNPSTGRQFSMDQVPTSSFYPNASNVADRSYPFLPGTGAVGSLGRNTFRLHGQNNFDIVFVKNTKLFGKDSGHQLQFRAEMYNLFNRIQFGIPNLTLLDTSVAGYRINPNFGQISATNNSPRSMQMMLRYQF